ncbi:MAG: hypothetical protein KA010_04440 [Saprospiraceae bacterium]|nr:hypothetical protein [Saprospiraceae bacterium]
MEELIPIQEISDEQDFYCGEIFREYKVHIPNVKNPEEDYYDYMLISLNSTEMLLANVSSNAGRGKAGYSIGYIPIIKEGYVLVTGKQVKQFFNIPDVFWVKQ